MRTKLITFLSIAFMLISFGANAKNKKENKKEEVTYQVSMTCTNCKKKIEKNIAFEKGVSDMKVNLTDKTVWLEFQTNKTDTTKLRTALEKLGYNVSQVQK